MLRVGWPGPDRVKEYPLRRVSSDRSLKRRGDALHDSKDTLFGAARCRYVDGLLRPGSVPAARAAMHETGDKRCSRAEVEHRWRCREPGLAVEEPDRDSVTPLIPVVDEGDDPSLTQGPERRSQRRFGRYQGQAMARPERRDVSEETRRPELLDGNKSTVPTQGQYLAYHVEVTDMTADDKHAASGRVYLPEMLIARHLDTSEQGSRRQPPKLQEVYVVQRLVRERTAGRCANDRVRGRAAVDNRLVRCSHAESAGAGAGQERRKGPSTGIRKRSGQPRGKGHPQAKERCRYHGRLLILPIH